MFLRQELIASIQSLSEQDQKTEQAKYLKAFCEQGTSLHLDYYRFLANFILEHSGSESLFDDTFLNSDTPIANLVKKFRSRSMGEGEQEEEDDIEVDDDAQAAVVTVTDFTPELPVTSSAEAKEFDSAVELECSQTVKKGMIAFGGRNYDDAIHYLKLAVAETSGGFVKPYTELGLSYYYKGDLWPALRNLTLAININKHRYLLNTRGAIYSMLGFNKAAICDFDQVIKQSPTPSEHRRSAITNRTLTYLKFNNEETIRSASELLTHEQDAYVLTMRAAAYIKNGKYNEAIQDYTQAIKLDEGGGYTGLLACARFFKGDPIESIISDLNTALAKDNAIDNLVFRATCYMRLNNFQSAAKDLRTVAEMPVDDSHSSFKFIANFTLRELKRENKLSESITEGEIFEGNALKAPIIAARNKKAADYYACALIAEESANAEKIESAVYDLFNNTTQAERLDIVYYGELQRLENKSKDILEARDLVAQLPSIPKEKLIPTLREKSQKVRSHAYLLVVDKEPFDKAQCLALQTAGAKNKKADQILSRKTADKFGEWVKAVSEGDMQTVKMHMVRRYSDPNEADSDGRIMLNHAVRNKKYEVVEYLLKDSPVDVDIDFLDHHGINFIGCLCLEILAYSVESPDAKKLFDLLGYVINVKKAERVLYFEGRPVTLDEFFQNSPGSEAMKTALRLKLTLDPKSKPAHKSEKTQTEKKEEKEKPEAPGSKKGKKHKYTVLPSSTQEPTSSSRNMLPLAPVLSNQEQIIQSLEKQINHFVVLQDTHNFKPAKFLGLSELRAELAEIRANFNEGKAAQLIKKLQLFAKKFGARPIPKAAEEPPVVTQSTSSTVPDTHNDSQKVRAPKPKPKKVRPDFIPPTYEQFTHSEAKATAQIMKKLGGGATHFQEVPRAQEQVVDDNVTFVVRKQPNNPIPEAPVGEKSLANKACAALLDLFEEPKKTSESKEQSEAEQNIDKYSKLYNIVELLGTGVLTKNQALDIFFTPHKENNPKDLRENIVRGGAYVAHYEAVTAFAKRIQHHIPSIIEYLKPLGVNEKELANLARYQPKDPDQIRKAQPIIKIIPEDFGVFRFIPNADDPGQLTSALFCLIDQIASHPNNKGGRVLEYDVRTSNALLMLMMLCRKEVVRLEGEGLHENFITFSNLYLEVKEKSKKGGMLPNDLKALVKEVQAHLGKPDFKNLDRERFVQGSILCLDKKFIRDVDVADVIVFLRENKGITTVTLKDNYLSEAGCKKLLQFAQPSHIREIHLTGNPGADSVRSACASSSVSMASVHSSIWRSASSDASVSPMEMGNSSEPVLGNF